MTYKKEIKLLSWRKHLHDRWIKYFLFVFLFVSFFNVRAQTPDFHFSNRSLSDALVIISDYFETVIAFDSDKLGQILVNKDIASNDLSDILTNLLEGTGFTFVRKYGSYLIICDKPANKRESIPVYNFSGVITDKKSGENLSFANIWISNTNSVISATVNGTFAVNKLLTDRLLLKISHIGYSSLDTIVHLSKNKKNIFHFKMKRKDELLKEVSIKKDKLRIIESNDEIGHTTIIPSSFVDVPNLGETDIFRSLQFLPGIAISENSSKLNIRGGADDQNLVLFDGVTLYNLDHFFGTFSSINPNVIKDIQVFKGGFDSRYGERLSAIVDITGKSGDKQKAKVYGGLNLVSGNITAEIPFTEKLTFVAAARRSYSDMYSSYLMDMLFEQQTETYSSKHEDNSSEVEPSYYFYDLYSKLTYQLNVNESFSLSVYGGKDYLDNSNTMLGVSLNTYTADYNKWSNFGISASWLKQWSSKLFTNLQLGRSGYFNEYSNETSFTINQNQHPDNPYETNESNHLRDYSITLKNVYSIDTKNQLDFGMAAKRNYYSYYKDGNDDFIYDDRENNSWLYTSYIQNTTQSLKNWKIKTGFRFNYYPLSGKFYFEPRLSGTYFLSDICILKFSTGKYYQFLSKVSQSDSYSYNRDFWVISDGDTYPVLSSNQYIVGGSLKPGNWYFDLEGYYKTLDGILSYQYFNQYNHNFDNNDNLLAQNKTSTKSYFSTGEGEAYGLDFMVKYESAGYTGWLSYSLSKVAHKFSNINNGCFIPASYDQRHGLTITNIYRYKKWNFSASWIFTTGHPYIVDETVDVDFTTTRTYGTLSNYQRFDIAANYSFMLKKCNFKVGCSIINLFDIDNYNDIYTRKFSTSTNSETETTYVESLGFTPNFFIDFKF